MITMFTVITVNPDRKTLTYKFVSYVEALRKGTELLEQGYTYKIKKTSI